VSVEKAHDPDAQKQPPGTTQSWPAPCEFEGHAVAHTPLLQPW
jgi:hypothetical protein